MEPDPAIFVSDIQYGNKKKHFRPFFAYYFTLWSYIYIIDIIIKDKKS